MVKRIWHNCYLALRSISQFRVKVKGRRQGQWSGQGQRSESRSKVGVKVKGQFSGTQRSTLGARLCRVKQRAKKSNYQSEVFLCVLGSRSKVRVEVKGRGQDQRSG